MQCLFYDHARGLQPSLVDGRQEALALSYSGHRAAPSPTSENGPQNAG